MLSAHRSPLLGMDLRDHNQIIIYATLILGLGVLQSTTTSTAECLAVKVIPDFQPANSGAILLQFFLPSRQKVFKRCQAP